MPRPPVHIADTFAAIASCELGVACTTVDGRFLDVNRSFCTMLGYTREDLLGRNVAEITHPDDVPGTVSVVQRIAAGAASSYATQKRYLHKNGGVVWVILHAVLVKSTAGAADGLLVLVESDVERKLAEQVLRASEQRLVIATRASGIGVWDWNIESGTLFWDDSMFQLYGIRRDDFAGAYEAWSSCVHPADRARAEAEVQACLRDRKPYDTEFRVVKADGEIRHIKSRAEVLCDDAGRVQRLIGTNWDITERKRTEDALLESHERLQLALEASNTGTWRVDLLTGMDTRDASMNRMIGLPAVPSTQPLSDWFSYLHPDDMAAIQSAWERGIESGVYDVEHRIVCRDGKVLWVQDRGIVVRDATGQPIYAIGAAMDIIEKKHKDELILTQASYDPLTGLPNRRLFQDRLEMEIRKAHRAGTRVALLLIDLDRFKEINDTLGHAKGDVLLVEAGRRISTCVREADTVARLGGDEFTVILSEFREPAQVERVAQDIIRELSEPFVLDENDIGHISATVGITIYPDDATEIVDLLKHADQAMYRAKGEGRSRFSYFTPSMQREAQDKRALTDDLRHALARGELQLYYQPIVSMRTRQIVKAEALLRWRHPQRGLIDPATFIPLAEESRLIVDIGNWVFREACACVARWRKQFGRVIQVSVNKSPVQFEHRVKMDWLESLSRSGLPGNSITVEITEGLLLKESLKVKERLLEFRNSGVEVSIDDFGTGFSSLSYLKQFDIDYLKIDRSFVRFLTGNDSDKALVEVIIVMAHKLDLQAIAEGVETEEQHELLAAFGCDYAQGFLYSPAVPEEEFVRLLGQ